MGARTTVMTRLRIHAAHLPRKPFKPESPNEHRHALVFCPKAYFRTEQAQIGTIAGRTHAAALVHRRQGTSRRRGRARRDLANAGPLACRERPSIPSGAPAASP